MNTTNTETRNGEAVATSVGLGTSPDLKPFCSTDEETRHYFLEPWSTNTYTYATDGRIMVRVPLREGHTPASELPNYVLPSTKELFRDFPEPRFYRFVPLPDFGPVERFVTCGDCHGSGAVLVTYPGGENDAVVCELCEGEKIVPNMARFRVGDRELAGHMIARLQLLPSLLIAVDYANEYSPLPFTFDGGQGVVMPLKPSKPSA